MIRNPTAPTLRSLIKVHKEGAPIRHVVNARAYSLAQMLVKVLSSLHVQREQYSPTNGRPTKNPTRTPNESRLHRHKQYVLKHTNRRSDKYP